MANNVVNSRGTGIFIKVGAGTSTKIAGVTDFSGIGGGSATIIDTTDLDSTATEKMLGVMDEGQFSITYNVVKSDAGQASIDTARAAGTLCEIRVVTSATTYTFSAYALSNEQGGGVNKQVTGSAKFEITGTVTKSATTI